MDDREGKINRMPLISVIIPVYNEKKFIHECVDSVLKQTYRNIEVILVDDGSSDGCFEICNKYAEKDNRVKVIHKRNGGLSDARNYGIKNARGEYLTFVDSDDVISSNMIQYLYRLCIQYNVLLAQCNNTVKNPEFDDVENGKVRGNLLKKDRCMVELLGDYCVAFCVTWGKLYHTSLIQNNIFPCGKLYEDVYTTHLFFEKAGKMVFTKKKLYYYRQHKNSLIAQMNRKPDLERFAANVNRAEYFYEHKYYGALERQINVCLNMTMRNYCKYYKIWSVEQKRYMVSECKKLLIKVYKRCHKSISCKMILFSLLPDIYYYIAKEYVK